MSELNAALGVHGSGIPLVVEDRTFYAMPLTKARQGELTAWLEAKTWGTLNRTRSYMSVDEWTSVAAKTAEAIASGGYEFGSRNMQKALQTQDGAKKFLELLLKEKQPNIRTEDVEWILDRVTVPDIESMLYNVYPKLKPPTTGTASVESGESL